MPPQITKLQRWLDLIAFLVGRHLPVSVEDIMDGIPGYASKWVDGSEKDRASVRRTFERDKDELRDLGIPVDTVTFRVNYGVEQVEGYRLQRTDFYLPYLKLISDEGGRKASSKPYRLPDVQLSEAEIGFALDALREVSALPSFPFAREARSAMRKIAFDLDIAAAGGDDDSVIYVDRPGADEVRTIVRPLSDALLARKSVRFRYEGIQRGEVTEREVWPYGLFFQYGNWYLVGHDTNRSDIRVFRVGRMGPIEVNPRAPKTADYTIPGDFRLDSYLRREAWELGTEEPVPVRVLFHFPRSLWAERNHHGTLVATRPEGAAVREFAVQQTNPFVRWLLSMGSDVEVLAPGSLAEELQAMAREVASLYPEAR